MVGAVGSFVGKISTLSSSSLLDFRRWICTPFVDPEGEGVMATGGRKVYGHFASTIRDLRSSQRRETCN